MSYQDSIEGEILCPSCETELIKIGTCLTCPKCGYSECGR